MATKKQLTERWHVELGKDILHKLYSLGIIEIGHGINTEEVFRLLEGLPFREEIANGRDFRGGYVWARELDFTNTNFSYARVANFFFCTLDHSIFNHCTAERASFHQSVNSCTFVLANLRSCYFTGSSVQNSDFSNAKLRGTSFQDADLRGCRFTGADCRRCTFAGANLIGCDFRQANLKESVFCENQLDKTTDFRGANLEGVYTDEWRNNAGDLRRRATDLSLGMLE